MGRKENRADLLPHRDGLNGRERVHDQGERGPEGENDIGEETDGAQPEGAVADVVAPLEEEADDGDGVGDVEENHAGGEHAVGEMRC